MLAFFKSLDKPLPKYINQSVRIWFIAFLGIYVTHTYGKLRQMDDKVNSTIFDARIQQMKSSMDHQLQLMDMRHELSMKQIQQLNQWLIELDRQLKNLNGLGRADVSNDHVAVSSDRVEWSVFNQQGQQFEDISHHFNQQFE
jgi:ABC-type phosphate transport system auxiliary subunit